jgi:hypothetical protein
MFVSGDAVGRWADSCAVWCCELRSLLLAARQCPSLDELSSAWYAGVMSSYTTPGLEGVAQGRLHVLEKRVPLCPGHTSSRSTTITAGVHARLLPRLRNMLFMSDKFTANLRRTPTSLC